MLQRQPTRGAVTTDMNKDSDPRGLKTGGIVTKVGTTEWAKKTMSSMSILTPAAEAGNSKSDDMTCISFTMRELVEKSNIKVNQKLVQRAEIEFIKVSPANRRVDMNQWDCVMRRIGIENPMMRHKVFKVFDADANQRVDYHEFVDGLNTLLQARLGTAVR